jgi:F-type H+-transporting ATPase subunit epsilon
VRLIVALPHRIEVDVEVSRVGAEGIHGSFTMLPRHLDYAVLLESGILTYSVAGEAERFVAIDGGLLTKVGDEVRVATAAAVAGDRLEELERTVSETFQRLDERERTARAALARIESHVTQEMVEFEEDS